MFSVFLGRRRWKRIKCFLVFLPVQAKTRGKPFYKLQQRLTTLLRIENCNVKSAGFCVHKLSFPIRSQLWGRKRTQNLIMQLQFVCDFEWKVNECKWEDFPTRKSFFERIFNFLRRFASFYWTILLSFKCVRKQK